MCIRDRGKKITVNQLGERLIDTLKKYSEKITSEELTREFETKLEGIMKAKVKKDEIISDAKVEVSSILDEIEVNKIKIGEELYAAYRESMIVGECKCGGNLIMINSPKGGSFVGCSASVSYTHLDVYKRQPLYWRVLQG